MQFKVDLLDYGKLIIQRLIINVVSSSGRPVNSSTDVSFIMVIYMD